MKVKMILPALTEAKSLFFCPIKYSLFPPLGLATLAGYLGPDDEVDIQDEHVEELDLSGEPDIVVIQVYITSAHHAYALADHYRARGAHVCLAACTSPRCLRKQPDTPIPSSSARAKTPGLPFGPISALDTLTRSIDQPSGRCWACRRCGAT